MLARVSRAGTPRLRGSTGRPSSVSCATNRVSISCCVAHWPWRTVRPCPVNRAMALRRANFTFQPSCRILSRMRNKGIIPCALCLTLLLCVRLSHLEAAAEEAPKLKEVFGLIAENLAGATEDQLNEQ